VLRKIVRRLGMLKTTVLTTIAVVFLSISLSVGIVFLLHGTLTPIEIVFAIVIPCIIAPIVNYVFLHLVFQLEDLQAKLRELAIRDELTQAFNRRHWIELAETELARAKRYGQSFSVILLDIDHFKGVNDTHGHLAGDSVLRELSSACIRQSRQVDAFARYGGEEFIFLLPQSDKTHARLFAERIRKTLAETHFCYNQIEIRITVSLGVITFDPSTTALDSLLMRVDQALYAAKKAGRNRAIVADEL
jgi:diguanylate cyclase (GGDEF)-like protein